MVKSNSPHGRTKSVDWFARTFSMFGLGVSVIAVTISILNTYSSADIKASASPPVWRWGGLEESLSDGQPTGQTSQQAVLLMSMTCAFTNVGAEAGSVDDVVVRFESESDRVKWAYSPFVILDGATSRHVKDSFYPLTVPGKDTISMTYMFQPEAGVAGFEQPRLVPHPFRMTLLTWSNRSNSWQEQQRWTVNFDEDAVKHLASGKSFVMPFAETQEHFRDLW